MPIAFALSAVWFLVALAHGESFCLDGLIGPYVPWDQISGVERFRVNYFTGTHDGPVFLKTHTPSPRISADLRGEIDFSMRLNERGRGPRYVGLTFRPRTSMNAASGSFVLVYAFIPGTCVRTLKRKNYRTVVARPRGFVLRDAGRRDFAETFDDLDDLAIEADDCQFLLTPAGRAVIIDFGAYRNARSRVEARSFNEPYRAAFLRAFDRR